MTERRRIRRGARSLRRFLNQYIQAKWVLGVYVAVVVLAFFAFRAAETQETDRENVRESQILYLAYLDDVRVYDRCIEDVERTNTVRVLLSVIHEQGEAVGPFSLESQLPERTLFEEILESEFPERTLDECGEAPVPPTPTPELLDGRQR